MNPSDQVHAEQLFLGSCLLDHALIDRATAAGLKPDMLQDPAHVAIWRTMLAQRAAGLQCDVTAIFLAMGAQCPSDALFACEKAAPTSVNGGKAAEKLIEEHCRTALRCQLVDAVRATSEERDYEELRKRIDTLPAVLTPAAPQEHTLEEIAEDAGGWTEAQLDPNRPQETVITTGLPHFDSHAGPIQAHEYVVIGARTSTGKSSFMAQLAQHNLSRGLRVVYFTLETSARAVFLQMAAQRAEVNLRALRDEFSPKIARFRQEQAWLRKQPIVILEKDLSLEQIEARCRLLATSFKPDVVLIDYMGLIKVKGDGQYEKTTRLSKAMIPLRKTLGCALIVAAQLNRGNEKESRAPTRTDFRDSGSIEEDAHRLLALYRPDKDDAGIAQGFDRAIYQQELFQLKLRDGSLAHTRLDFWATNTRFTERK